MKESESQNLSKNNPANFGSNYLILAVSLFAFVLIFLVADSALGFGIKISVFLLIVFAYALVFWFFYPKQIAEKPNFSEEKFETEDFGNIFYR